MNFVSAEIYLTGPLAGSIRMTMGSVVITGSCGLIGAEAARFFARQGYDIAGIDNDMRRVLFGDEASTRWARHALEASLGRRYAHYEIDIRDQARIIALYRHLGANVALTIHTAAQPSHDWAARDPQADFTINANGTLNLLQAVRDHAPESVFIFTSTNKVYGDAPNRLPVVEHETRFELADSHPFALNGIDESMSIDQTKHSLFGASKVAADILVQEYGRYFGIKTGVFRGGCLTGPGHSGTELHGFLAYLARCAVTGRPYTVFGYRGKQVRDNIHSADLVQAFWRFFCDPKIAAVYNIGGGRRSNCSMLEAILLVETASGHKVDWTYREDNRIGDHIWWISDLRCFRSDYAGWDIRYTLDEVVREIVEAQRNRTRMISSAA